MSDIVTRLRNLVSLNNPEHGGPYQGTAAVACMEAMAQAADIIGYERALADAGADVLSRMVVGWKDLTGIDLAEHPDVIAFFARYREARK